MVHAAANHAQTPRVYAKLVLVCHPTLLPATPMMQIMDKGIEVVDTAWAQTGGEWDYHELRTCISYLLPKKEMVQHACKSYTVRVCRNDTKTAALLSVSHRQIWQGLLQTLHFHPINVLITESSNAMGTGRDLILALALAVPEAPPAVGDASLAGSSATFFGAFFLLRAAWARLRRLASAKAFSSSVKLDSCG